MRGLRLRLAALLLVLPACAATALADVKIKNRQTMSGQASEQTIYIKGKRQRTEMLNGQMIAVQQCDLRRDLQISHATKTYTVTPYGAPDSASTPTPAAASQPQGAAAAVTRGGLVSTIVTSKDTGERKQMFGYTARHILTTIVTESSPDSCAPVKSKMQIDGWYIDAAFALSCDNGGRYQNYRPAQSAGCQDRHEYKQLGTAKTGFPVWTKTTMFGEDGRETYTMLQETIELSQETLDAALFDVPAGYREVKDASELYAAAATTSDTSLTPTAADVGGAAAGSSESGLGASVREKSRPKADAAPAALGAKREGVTRLGLATVKTGAVGDGMSAADLASAVQHTLAEYLKGPGVELVTLEARLPAQIDAEARQKECDFVVYASVSHKKGGGGGFGKMFGGGASVLGSIAPVGGMASSTAGAVAGQVATTVIYTAANMSANVKSKDELTLDVKVQAPGGAAPAAARQFKARAKSNGEDIISPLIEQAAQAVMDAAAGR